ncbi:hypothetical protein ACWD0G_29895 [Streptomyces goshikiensis]
MTAGLGSVVCGLFMAGLAGAASGPLGSRELVRFGPVWWQAGGAAAAWTLAVAVPLAVAVHGWRNRPPAAGAGDEWHASGSRDVRWETLRRAAGVPLVPDPAPVAAPVPPVPPVAAPVPPVPPVRPQPQPNPVPVPEPGPEPEPDPVPTPIPDPVPVTPVAPPVPPVSGARVLSRRRPPL